MATVCITVKLLSVVCAYASISLTTFLLMLVPETPASRSCGGNPRNGSISNIGSTIDGMPTDAVAGKPRAARLRRAPAAHQQALDQTWRSGQTHPFTPLTYNYGALMPQVWTEES